MKDSVPPTTAKQFILASLKWGNCELCVRRHFEDYQLIVDHSDYYSFGDPRCRIFSTFECIMTMLITNDDQIIADSVLGISWVVWVVMS